MEKENSKAGGIPTHLPPMRSRYQNSEIFNRVLRADWMKAIELSPSAYDALLYLPESPEILSSTDNSNYESDEFGSIDVNQDVLTYQDPFVVAVVDCPNDDENFSMMANNNDGTGEAENPLLLRVACDKIPQGSVLEWSEETREGDRRVWWYVHHAIGYGVANIGALYACIPCRNFDSKDKSLESKPDNIDYRPPALSGDDKSHVVNESHADSDSSLLSVNSELPNNDEQIISDW